MYFGLYGTMLTPAAGGTEQELRPDRKWPSGLGLPRQNEVICRSC